MHCRRIHDRRLQQYHECIILVLFPSHLFRSSGGHSVLKYAVLRIREVYSRSRIRIFSIPDPIFSIPDPHQKCFNLKNCFRALGSMIRVVHPGSGSRIRIMIFYPSRIQGSIRHRIPDPLRSRSLLFSKFIPYILSI